MDQTDDRINIRPKNFEAIRPYVDKLDRQHLHSLNPLKLLRYTAGVHMPVDMVPPDFWTLDTDDEGFTVAVVACPCGETPRVEALGLVTCECERGFFFTGEEITVINSQRRTAADAAA